MLKEINSGIFEVHAVVKKTFYGSKFIDKISGYELESTKLKIQCEGFTIMVFDKDVKLFNGIEPRNEFKAIVKHFDGNVYNFKKNYTTVN